MSNSAPNSAGKVWLVGAGPGDPDLLTLRAARLIMQAKLIVHDGLVDPAILALPPPAARLISVAKQRSRHTMPQDDINALLVREALGGTDVVRLKGGDPFIFGRGGEEAEACHAAGVTVEVVPGISAAIGGAAGSALALGAAWAAPEPFERSHLRMVRRFIGLGLLAIALTLAVRAIGLL